MTWKLTFAWFGLTAAYACGAAYADIPVIDNSNLNRHSETHAHTNKTQETQAGTKANTQGIDCSVHLGDKKANAEDHASNPNAETAGNALKHYGGVPITGEGATGATDAAARGQTGQVAAQQDASSQDAKDGEQALQDLARRIGANQTLKGAFDQNSVVALQNGMQINSVIRIANAWVQAANLINILNAGRQSTAATVTSSPTTLRCVAGTIGQGTEAQPCRSKACETTELSQAPDPACISVRYHDSYNNVVTYLLTVEDAVNFKDHGLVLN